MIEARRVPIDKIIMPDRQTDRRTIRELASSIKEMGMLQPISVRKKGRKFEVIDGAARLRACIFLGKDTIMVIVIEEKK